MHLAQMGRLKVEFFCRRNSFNKMIRKFRRPFKRLSTSLGRRFRRMRIGNWWQRVVDDCHHILEYSQIEGFNHLANRKLHFIERIIWLLILFICNAGVIYTCTYQWNRYAANPTVISLERDYRSWNGTLPAITICYEIRVDPQKAERYIQDNWNISSEHEEFEYFMNFVETMANLTLSDFSALYDYEEDERMMNVDLAAMVQYVHPDYKHIVRTFDEHVEYDKQRVITERGVCYAINAPLTLMLKTRVKSVSEFGPTLTCHFARNQCYMKVDIYGSTATLEVHSPNEVPTYDANVFPLGKTDEVLGVYKVVETLASETLRDLNLRQRKCVFRHEIIDDNSKLSGTLCKMRCRASNAMELCNCRPFYYPFVDGPECTLAGLLCLHRYSWPVWTLRVCKCQNTCVDLKYLEHQFKYRYWGVGDLPFIQKGSFRSELLPAKVRHRRDVLFSFEDFLVSFGGAATLFWGISCWQISHIVYILSEKLFSHIFCCRVPTSRSR